MSKKTITYKQVEQLRNECNQFLLSSGFLEINKTQTGLDWTDKPATKLSSAVKNVMKQCEKHIAVMEEELSVLRVNNALTDSKTGALLYEKDSQVYQYSKDGLLKLKKEIKEFKETEVEIHQRIVEGETIDLDNYEMFADILVTIN